MAHGEEPFVCPLRKGYGAVVFLMQVRYMSDSCPMHGIGEVVVKERRKSGERVAKECRRSVYGAKREGAGCKARARDL